MELFSNKSSDIINKIENNNDKIDQQLLKITSLPNNQLTSSFVDLNISNWLCTVAKAMGYKRPTDIQRLCIPDIILGKDCIACAQTGSGKTVCFAFPILQQLSKDPFGIFAVVLTPTRELAMQIAQQFTVFGQPINIKVGLVIGGMNIIEQSLVLSKQPHIVIATPGRLRHHLLGPSPPNLSKARYLVLDECDRLLATGFQAELVCILSNMTYKKRQTLLFSATMTETLNEVEKLAMNETTVRFDLTINNKVPNFISQVYLFSPEHVKVHYLYCYLLSLAKRSASKLDSQADDMRDNRPNKRKERKDSNNNISLSNTIIIFVSNCLLCEELSIQLNNLSIPNVSAHSLMNQTQRIRAINDFKDSKYQVLIATDLISRGLDISIVDVVINFDLPNIASDYIHRVGRTGRQRDNKHGIALSLITPNDITKLHSIESYINNKLTLCDDVNEQDIVKVLNVVSKAHRVAKQKILDDELDKKYQIMKKRKLKK